MILIFESLINIHSPYFVQILAKGGGAGGQGRAPHSSRVKKEGNVTSPAAAEREGEIAVSVGWT